MLDLSRSAPPMTDREIGTSCRRCSRFCAVTTISSSAGASAVASAPAAANAGMAEKTNVVAGSKAAAERINGEFIFIPSKCGARHEARETFGKYMRFAQSVNLQTQGPSAEFRPFLQ